MVRPVLHPWYRVYDAGTSALDSLRSAVVADFESGSVHVLRVTNARAQGDPLAFWHDFGSMLGASADITGDAAIDTVLHGDRHWMDVRFRPERQDSFRYASTAQPLHNDSAHVVRPADVGLFFMEKQAGEGGESVFLDADTIAAVASAQDRELFRDLTELPVYQALAPGSPGPTCPLLQRDGARWIVRWNYYRVMPGQGDAVEALRERFRRFLDDLLLTDHVEVVRLENGDAVIFDDRAVLHARTAFRASESSERLLWKTYFTR
jgi:hypothetical protein